MPTGVSRDRYLDDPDALRPLGQSVRQPCDVDPFIQDAHRAAQATDVGADGTIAYHCTLHDGEEGTITVVKS